MGVLLIAAIVLTFSVAPVAAQDDGGKWCEGVHIRFFVGGAEGDAFASIILRGAQQAEADMGPSIDYIFSGWDAERITQQLREAINVEPDAIVYNPFAGQDATLPLAEEAYDAGIIMEYVIVDVPEVRARFGGGLIGADNEGMGIALASEAIRQYGLQEGDKVIVFGPWSEATAGRIQKEEAAVMTLEAAGVEVVRGSTNAQVATDPQLLLPTHTALMLDNPDAKMVIYPGGPILNFAPVYLAEAGMEPGDIIAIGFDLPEDMQGFEDGWISMTVDQQPYQAGYLSVLSVCGTAVYNFAPLEINTGAGIVDTSNFAGVADLVRAGIR
jgi:simple sugar transport system substrate-binding protein